MCTGLADPYEGDGILSTATNYRISFVSGSSEQVVEGSVALTGIDASLLTSYYAQQVFIVALCGQLSSTSLTKCNVKDTADQGDAVLLTFEASTASDSQTLIDELNAVIDDTDGLAARLRVCLLSLSYCASSCHPCAAGL